MEEFFDYILKGDIMKEFEKDKVEFEWLMDFINVSHEHEFECKHNITIDAYNKAIGRIDEIATKYNLHNENRYGPWYELYDLWPRMKKFFNNNNYAFKKALDELWWYSDQEEPMSNFCKFIKEFANDMKGSAKAEIINLYDYGFEHNIYVAYNDENEGVMVLTGSDFIEHIKCAMETLDNEYKEIWYKAIMKIIEKYE